jgi:pyrroline-5-carboxylate reductase
MQAMIESAIQMGFSASEAEFLVNQTFAGSVQLQKRSKIGNEEWIEKVASKGGTTEAALEVFGNWNMKSIIDTALNTANERAIALGKK